MYFDHIEWADEDNPAGNTRHIAAHDVTQEEVEHVLANAAEADVFSNRSSGRPSVIGDTADGRTLFVAFERDEEAGIIILTPVTAFDYHD
jgi:uncharacterized DUF497 family protein